MNEQPIPRVALVGRTNVGKSTLFNRLLEQKKALVSPVSGTTRDRNEGECLWRGSVIKITDTGGFEALTTDDLERQTTEQAMTAIKEADLVLFVIDAKIGILPQEQELARMLKKTNVPVLVVANKAETPAERMQVISHETYLHGLPTPIAISALRGTSVGDLLDEVYDTLIANGKHPVISKTPDAIRIAVIGKPNVGKSTLLNSMLGEERFITSPIAHTTREPNDTYMEVGGQLYQFIDTAGMRKTSKVRKAGGLESQSVRRNEQIVRTADVTLLVIDASEPIGTQEKTLAGFIKDSGSGVLIIVNKWDLVPDKTTTTMNRYREYITASIPFLKIAPVLFVSALSKQRVKTIYDSIKTVNNNRSTWIEQKELDNFLETAVKTHTPAAGKGAMPPKILGLKQVGVKPLAFDLIVKAKRDSTLSQSYMRFLINKLFDKFELHGTPIRLNIRVARSVSK